MSPNSSVAIIMKTSEQSHTREKLLNFHSKPMMSGRIGNMTVKESSVFGERKGKD